MFTKQLSLCHVPACFDNAPLGGEAKNQALHLAE